MRFFKLLLAVDVPLGLVAAPGMAQEDEQGPNVVTEEEAEPDEATEELALPEEASEEGKANSARGLDTANEAREKRREFGEERSREARERRGRPDDVPAERSGPGAGSSRNPR